MMTAPLDGNASAGDLADIFAVDVTVARTTCAACGATRPLAELHAYMRSAGTVLRCASCDAVQLRLVRSEDRAWIDLTGVSVMELPIASA